MHPAVRKHIDGDGLIAEMENALFGDDNTIAVCTTEGCDNTDDLEPDAENCLCDECGNNTLTSVLRIEGMI